MFRIIIFFTAALFLFLFYGVYFFKNVWNERPLVEKMHRYEKTNLLGIAQTLEEFLELKQSFPLTNWEEQLYTEVLHNKGAVGNFKDLWGRAYIYEIDTENVGFKVGTLGSDGIKGGEEENQDIYVLYRDGALLLEVNGAESLLE